MAKAADTLTEDEVHQISRLVETLNKSTFDFLQVEIGAMKVTLSKGGSQPPGVAGAPSVAALPAAAPAPAVTAAAPVPAIAAASAPGPAAPAAVPGLVDIVAPMIGKFYSQSEPGQPPYVQVGSRVADDSTVGLIEAMKIFNAVHAGRKGVIEQICAQDAMLVEYGQVLFRIRPD